ncbi:hypothetical protein ABMY44_06325 [Pseudoalteromonas sp. Cnat2-41]|uniref:hypothetical protein n=1 Tax=unclassified Pseudoalteromonas TaxID=194690 RepID=UPI001EF866CE|nr:MULTISPECIES: hypothetical protein [unclassified Pseudoalteromonas]MCF2861770.1 hypothetical protein [Pseudoalteromonas sp. CNAT2-18]MCG7557191.1 hypothetical protein [Pseudoalteromonas sp. CNAT2-18.1]
MSKYLYVVKIDGGKNHPQHDVFYKNVDNLNAKTSDYGGIKNMCVISHTQTAETLHLMCSDGIDDESTISVEEITRTTLNDSNCYHSLYEDLIERYFLPHGSYPNIQ